MCVGVGVLVGIGVGVLVGVGVGVLVGVGVGVPVGALFPIMTGARVVNDPCKVSLYVPAGASPKYTDAVPEPFDDPYNDRPSGVTTVIPVISPE